jgi:hypothetical protein
MEQIYISISYKEHTLIYYDIWEKVGRDKNMQILFTPYISKYLIGREVFTSISSFVNN